VKESWDILTPGGTFPQGGEITMREDQSVAEMANEVLMRQAKARAERSGEPIEEAMEVVLDTEAGKLLKELRDGPLGEESVEETQVEVARERAEDEARAFLESARQSGERFEALYVLAITTGLRRGELLGLRWDDADLELGTLRVGRALVREGGRHTLGETKTRRGRRQINLTPRTVNALKNHRKKQLEEKMKLVGLYKDHGLIFASGVGTPINPENLIKRSFKPLLEKAGLPKIRFHDLRHTCATLLLGRGVHPKLVQELLGHATIAMTLDTYSHYLPSMGDQTAGAMGNAFG